MGLAVETPTPPDLTNRPLPAAIDPDSVVDATGDLRREEIEGALRDGAWSDAFGEWAEYTDLSETEYRTIHDAGLVQGLDFYSDPEAGGIEFELPPIPDALGEDDLAGRATVELSDLGEIVADVLEEYVDWTEPTVDEEEGES